MTSKEHWRKRETVEDEDNMENGEKVCLTEIITVTKWFHRKAHRGLEAVAIQVLQAWVALSVYAATKIIINGCPICKKFSDIKLMEISHFFQF